MKRILRALSAFALALVLTLTLASVPVYAAENGSEDGSDVVSAGYIVLLEEEPDQAGYSADPFAAATLMAAEDEREELLPLAGSWRLYKAASLAEIQSLVYSGRVAVVEPDYQAELFDVVPVTPNDPYFSSSQGSLTDTYGIGVRSAWEAGLTGEGVTVAVIDSGLNDTHEDMPVRVGRGRYFYYLEDPNGRYTLEVKGVLKRYSYWSSSDWKDDTGHGSMVCGIIAAAANNQKGIAGIAPGATILPIRCFTNTENHAGGFTSNLISGINFAVENGADIINMSWGLPQKSTTLQTAIDAAYQAGCILIAAAGNSGGVVSEYPAAWENVISVGSVDHHTGTLASYSQRVTSVNVCAPGGTSGRRIVSLGDTSDTVYLTSQGTSFSAPAVAAAAALLKQADPGMTQGDFLTLLKQTSHPLDREADRRYSGAGCLDIQALLDKVGYAGAAAKRTAAGIEVYAGYHPLEGADEGVITLVAGYNAAGHLIESKRATPQLSSYHNRSQAVTLTHPDIATVQTYYLHPTTFCSLSGAPISPLILGSGN